MILAMLRLKAREPSWDASQSWIDQYDKSLVKKLNPTSSDRPLRTLNTTLRPLRRPTVDAGLPTHPLSASDADRKALKSGLLPDALSSPVSGKTSISMDDAQMRPGLSPDSAVSVRSMPPSFPTRSFLSPRAPPRQGSSLSSVPETEPVRVDTDGGAHRPGSGSMRGSLTESVNGSSQLQRGIYGQIIFDEPEPESSEETQMRRLRLGESDRMSLRRRRYSPHSKVGRKRRASSPPQELDERLSQSASGNSNELFHRRSSGHLAGQQTPPINRFVVSSLSSTSSIARTGSVVSSTGITSITNSLASLPPVDRTSPGGLSPASELDSGSPFVGPLSLNPSPRDSLAKAHHRAFSEVKPSTGVRRMSRDESSQTKQHGLSRIHGVYICECCPKKPKRFDSADELR